MDEKMNRMNASLTPADVGTSINGNAKERKSRKVLISVLA
jgi:hypothetical protein